MLLPVLVERAPGDVFSSSCVVEYDLLLLITAYDLDPDNSTTGPLRKWPVFSSSSSVNILFVILRGKFELNYLFRWLDFTPKTLPHLVQEKKKITLSPLRLPFFLLPPSGATAMLGAPVLLLVLVDQWNAFSCLASGQSSGKIFLLGWWKTARATVLHC